MIAAIVLSVLPGAGVAQSTCLDPGELVRLDQEWEQAMLTRDTEWLETHVSGDFIWVHDHAGLTESKTELIERASAPIDPSQAARSRTQSEVEARVVGSTGLVTGFTVVDWGPGPMRFNFMRTYVRQGGRCLLLGNHTMVVPPPDAPSGGPSN